LKKFKNTTLKSYLDILSKKEPVPGGGSVAAYTAALAVGLIVMVARYSEGKSELRNVDKKIKKIISDAQVIKDKLLVLVDLDAEAYMGIVKAKGLSAQKKNQALKKAQKVSLDVSRLCLKAVDCIPYLVVNGNKYLLSDLEVAAELLLSAHRGAMILYKTNQ
jgi:formiminotetrahydrofolate cyclodeaminase